MKQTKMTHEELIASVMAEYTARYNEQQARSAANRKAFAEGRPFPFPAPEVQSTNWNISDRH